MHAHDADQRARVQRPHVHLVPGGGALPGGGAGARHVDGETRRDVRHAEDGAVGAEGGRALARVHAEQGEYPRRQQVAHCTVTTATASHNEPIAAAAYTPLQTPIPSLNVSFSEENKFRMKKNNGYSTERLIVAHLNGKGVN